MAFLYSHCRYYITSKVNNGVPFSTFQDEFFPLSPYIYYISSLYCNPSTNSLSFLSKLEHVYPSLAPQIPGDPTYRIQSITRVPKDTTTFYGVGVVIFRNYNNIFHVLESLNSIIRYVMNASLYPALFFFNVFF